MKPKIHVRYSSPVTSYIHDKVIQALYDGGIQASFGGAELKDENEIFEIKYRPRPPKELIEKIIEHLELAKILPVMFFEYNDDIVRTQLYFAGFSDALRLVGIEMDGDIFDSIRLKHGWPIMATMNIDDMIVAGLSNTEIVQEQISIQLEAWQEYLNQYEYS